MKLKLIVAIALSTLLITACTDFTNPLSSEEDFYSGTSSNGSGTSSNGSGTSSNGSGTSSNGSGTSSNGSGTSSNG
ncbi:hypothetical protein ACFL0J_02735 [Candidatus Neomarinimicrobiota bacterium]|jgi:hypothetical protein